MFNVWAMVAAPTTALWVTVVLLANLGGVYNCIAYTVIRRRLQKQTSRGTLVVAGTDRKPVTVTSSISSPDSDISTITVPSASSYLSSTKQLDDGKKSDGRLPP